MTTNIYSSARVFHKFQVVFCRVSKKPSTVSPGLYMIWQWFEGFLTTIHGVFGWYGFYASRREQRDPIRGAIEMTIFSAGLKVFQAESKSPKSVSKTFASWFWCMIKTHPKILLKMAFFCQVFDEKSDFFASATATPPKVVPRLQRIATSCRLAPKPIC